MKDDMDLLAAIESQETSLIFPGFTTDDAFTIGSLIRSNFLSKYSDGSNGVAISIDLFSGDCLFRASVGNKLSVTQNNWTWIAGKTRTVARFNRSSLAIGTKARVDGKEYGKYGPVPLGAQDGEYVQHGGCFPIWIKGVNVGPIGVIAVSGLPQLVDHQLIVDSVAEHLDVAVVSVLDRAS